MATPIQTPPLYGCTPPPKPSFTTLTNAKPADLSPKNRLVGKFLTIQEQGGNDMLARVDSVSMTHLTFSRLKLCEQIKVDNVEISPCYLEEDLQQTSVPWRSTSFSYPQGQFASLLQPQSESWQGEVTQFCCELDKAKWTAEQAKAEREKKTFGWDDFFQLVKVLAWLSLAGAAVTQTVKYAFRTEPIEQKSSTPKQPNE